METLVSHQHRVDRRRDETFANFDDEPRLWLPRPVRPVGPSRWRVKLRAGPAHHLAVMEMGRSHASARSRRRKVTWWPVRDKAHLDEHSLLLPDFAGEITVEEDEAGRVVVETSGSYTPPAGIVGAALDRMVLHRVADATIRWLTETIAQRLASIVVFE